MRQSVLDAAAQVRAAFGSVDLVVANAGIMLGAPFEQAEIDEWDQMVGTNINGLLYTGRAFIDDLLAAAGAGRRADLVFVGSIGGHAAFANYGVYCATKAAVAHLTRTLRTELGPRGVRVKNIEPGFTGTELGAGMRDDTRRAELAGWREGLEILLPEDIADAIAFAVSAPRRVTSPNSSSYPPNRDDRGLPPKPFGGSGGLDPCRGTAANRHLATSRRTRVTSRASRVAIRFIRFG
ncbi:SDR family oxidoreductase [Nocardia fluminea]|uniref:SDR family oxidoreductase n=1 Tax=Nocardia fluminea TaxID=134984 RepID=UPI00380554AE